MKYFSVTVMEKGQRKKKTLQSEDSKAALKLMRSKSPHIVIIKIEEIATPPEERIASLIRRVKSGRKKISIDDKISTIRQIAVMLDASIPINSTLEEVARSTDNVRLKEIYSSINADINSGNSMSNAIRPFVREFGPMALAMTDLGERTGNLSEAYHKLADITENIRDNNTGFKKAIRTPIITLIAMAIAFTVLIMVVVPKFKDIFSRFKTELPLPTRILLDIEWLMSNYGLYVLVAIIVGIYILKYYYANDKNFQLIVDQVLIHPRFYLINKIILLSSMYKYNLVFTELTKANIPISEALDTSIGMVTNLALKEKLFVVNSNISRGGSLTESLELTELYENMLLQMINAGEASGQLDSMLSKVTNYYDMEFQNLIDNLSSYIEPVMMFFISALVLLMALGIFMPMWDLGKTVQG